MCNMLHGCNLTTTMLARMLNHVFIIQTTESSTKQTTECTTINQTSAASFRATDSKSIAMPLIETHCYA